MNTEVKREWLAALRSGEFQQGYSKLAQAGRYCCLGVLCELAHKAGIVEKRQKGEFTYYDESVSYLPKSVQTWAGLDEIPIVSTPTKKMSRTSLPMLNDSDTSFNAIADYIEDSL